ncbi:DNA polymerase Y family protein [Lacimicrobium sp. SS2-24]|uniref:Y-family DNA polymerase n=1 Tax=Lacimicrobium sp. SS2-24 TaxID=2005569 RepID=UPI000B4BDC26|nr:DNA polymerase Y family protein [Lacimicrobium sp. SS2-24]
MASELWLYLHFPSLQLDSLYADQQHPLVVVDKTNNRVIQLNEVARERGIRPGMGLGTAASLDHALQVAEHQPHTEDEKLYELAAWLYGCTSDIALCSPNGLLLRAHPMLSLYNGLRSYWQALQQRLAPIALNYTYACGHTPLAAKVLARQGYTLVTDDAEVLLNALQRCPLSVTDLSAKQQSQLKRTGVRYLSELLSIPGEQLTRRFDHELTLYIGRLTGRFSHPQRFYYPPAVFRQTLTLLYGIENTQRLLPPLNTLLTRLEEFLRLREKLTSRLQLELVQQNKAILEIQVESAQAEYQASHWQALIALKFETIQLSEAIHAVILKVTSLEDKQRQTEDLFLGRQGKQTPLQLMSVLQARLGKDALSGITLVDDFRPEKSSQYCPAHRNDLPPSGTRVATMRPLQLCDPPVTLHEKVSLRHGPERIQTGWWDGHPVQRDYFIARSIQGQWLWVFRTPESHWFIQGIFS